MFVVDVGICVGLILRFNYLMEMAILEQVLKERQMWNRDVKDKRKGISCAHMSRKLKEGAGE